MTSSRGHADNLAAGIGWMLATMCLFTSMDTVAKYLTLSFDIQQVVWARFTFHMLFLMVWLRGRLLTLAVTGNLKLQLVRSACLLLTTTLFFSGLRTTPIATASTIMFLSPVLVTVLAIPLLGEQVGVRRWVGVAIGFVGALIIVRPAGGDIAVGHLYLIGAAFSNAFYQIATRQVRATDDPMTSLLYSGLVGAVVMSAAVPGVWIQPDTLSWGLFIVVGALGAISHFCLIRAFNAAEASAIVPFSYSSLLWATLLGYLVFNNLPDQWTLLGAAFIVSGGLYIFHREQRRLQV
jgi:drug/metabolite transporter (DMT)-like permease